MKPSRLATALVTSACVFASCKEESKPAGQGGGARPAHAANTSPAKEPPKPSPQPAAPVDPPPVKPPPAVPTTAPTGGSAPAASGAGHAVTPIDEATKKWFISVERAKELYDKREVDGKQVIFIDARTFLEFRDDGHIRGAMHYATNYTRGRPQPKVRNYLPGSAIVIYCHGELCTDSVEVGRYFESLKLDIGPVFIIQAGFPGWKAAYPNLVDTGNEVGFD